jgi:phosphoribosylformylglycinamidine synthase
MMFAQANSEHCRHKIFNASWTIDGEKQDQRLFRMIKSTTEKTPDGVISAYSDNAAVFEGWNGQRNTNLQKSRYTFLSRSKRIITRQLFHHFRVQPQVRAGRSGMKVRPASAPSQKRA